QNQEEEVNIMASRKAKAAKATPKSTGGKRTRKSGLERVKDRLDRALKLIRPFALWETVAFSDNAKTAAVYIEDMQQFVEELPENFVLPRMAREGGKPKLKVGAEVMLSERGIKSFAWA